MWELLLYVTHFFLQKRKYHTYACISVPCSLSENLHVIWNKKKSAMVVNKMCSLSRTEEVIEQQLYLWNTEVSMNDMLVNMLLLSFTHALTLQSVHMCKST